MAIAPISSKVCKDPERARNRLRFPVQGVATSLLWHLVFPIQSDSVFRCGGLVSRSWHVYQYDEMVVIELLYDDQVNNLPAETLHQDFEVQNSLSCSIWFRYSVNRGRGKFCCHLSNERK